MATIAESHFPFLPATFFPHSLLALPILFLLLSLFLIRNRRPTLHLPPGPKPWPILGNLLHVGSMPHVAFARLSQAHGPLISLRLGTQTVVVGSTPEAASEILKTHDHDLSGRSVPHVSFARDPELNHDSIAWSTHCTDHWRSLRSMVRAELFTSRAIEQQSDLREKHAREMARFLNRKRGQEMLAAVSDTTSASMEWALAELLKNPDTMTAARREFDGKFPEGHVIKESDLADLPYLCACVKETLRLHPPAPLLLPRRAAKDCHVMGYTVPQGAHVFVNVWAIGRDPRYWEDASSFKPERFMVGDVDFKGSHFEFLPFGSGRRICSGLPMAVREIQLAVATLVHGFDWSLPEGTAAGDLEMEERYGVTLKKLNPLVLFPTPRV
ncbi:unnamed protein product [Linum tenue]|uniref:Cytochrome P450 n=1 Tax=Linum tenue TaxID=586396 RepID=A0AAV0J2X1_9ROSI|nr:unnamed protein product [Linum tenue]